MKYVLYESIQDKIEPVESYTEPNPEVFSLSAEDDWEIEIVWGDQFIKQKYQINPLISDLMAVGDSMLIVGPTGIGKSIFIMNLALALGSPSQQYLWDRFYVPHPLKSIIIQAENTAANMNDRIRKICKGSLKLGMGITNVGLPKLDGQMRWTGEYFQSESFRKKILQTQEKAQADLIIFDPLSCYAGCEENSNSEMRKALDWFIKVCSEANLSPIIVHHMGKMNSAGAYASRGASAVSDWASCIINLKKKSIDKEQLIEVVCEKCRNFEEFESFYLRKDSNLVLEPVLHSGIISNAEVFKIITKNKGIFSSKKDFQAAIKKLKNCSNRIASAAIDNIVNAGLVVTSQGPRHSTIYKIP